MLAYDSQSVTQDGLSLPPTRPELVLGAIAPTTMRSTSLQVPCHPQLPAGSDCCWPLGVCAAPVADASWCEVLVDLVAWLRPCSQVARCLVQGPSPTYDWVEQQYSIAAAVVEVTAIA
jgi:hypothetical protein